MVLKRAKREETIRVVYTGRNLKCNILLVDISVLCHLHQNELRVLSLLVVQSELVASVFGGQLRELEQPGLYLYVVYEN